VGGVGIQVQGLRRAAWEDLGRPSVSALDQAVEKVARGPGIYRCKETSDDVWHFFYVDENHRVINSNAASRL
jgi:hypothetical protein